MAGTLLDAWQAQLQAQADTAAIQAGVPPSLFSALIGKESNWDPFAVGSIGEYGLTQLRPTTANDLNVSPYIIEDNLKGGATYLKQQFDTFGNWYDALRAYNAGPTAAANSPTAGATYAQSLSNAIPQTQNDPLANSPPWVQGLLSIFGAGEAVNALPGQVMMGQDTTATTTAIAQGEQAAVSGTTAITQPIIDWLDNTAKWFLTNGLGIAVMGGLAVFGVYSLTKGSK